MAVSLSSLTVFAQVGINNNSPKATLDITAKTTDGSKPEGLLAPRLTGDQIQAGDAQYTAAQKGLIIYATAAPASPSGKTANMTSEGYYYFNGSTWQKILATSVEDPTLGSILAFPYNALPVGYLECNGSAVSRTVYAALFAKIGTTYGSGDGSTTFNLPDLRGEFIRGWDNGRGVDPTRLLGSTQSNTTALPNTSFTGSTSSYTHNHGVGDGTNNVNTVNAGSYGLIRRTNSGNNGTITNADNVGSGNEPDLYNSPRVIPNDSHSHTVTVSGGGDSETRPRNIAMVYAIKAVESVLVPSNTSTAISAAAAANEPWYKAGTTIGANANTDNVYIMGNVGIGTSSPGNLLEISSSSNNTGLKLPYGAAAGKILTSDASGNSSWQSSNSVFIYSEIHGTGLGQTFNPGSTVNFFHTIKGENVKTIYGNSYGWIDATQRWVAPYTGKYRVTTNMYYNSNSGGNPRVYAYVNGSTICNITSASNDGVTDGTAYTSAIVTLNQGDYIVWSIPTGTTAYKAALYGDDYHTFIRVESVE